MVMWYIRKRNEKALKSKPVSHAPSQPQDYCLCLGYCPAWVLPWLPSMINCDGDMQATETLFFPGCLSPLSSQQKQPRAVLRLGFLRCGLSYTRRKEIILLPSHTFGRILSAAWLRTLGQMCNSSYSSLPSLPSGQTPISAFQWLPEQMIWLEGVREERERKGLWETGKFFFLFSFFWKVSPFNPPWPELTI